MGLHRRRMSEIPRGTSVIYPPTEICREATHPSTRGFRPSLSRWVTRANLGLRRQAALRFGGLAAVRIFAVSTCMSWVGRLRRWAPVLAIFVVPAPIVALVPLQIGHLISRATDQTGSACVP
jgi:hypothetical protein